VPLLGGAVAGLLRGDPIVTGATLSRFFGTHVIVLPWMAFALLAFHFTLVRRHGVAPPEKTTGDLGSGRRFFPSHLLRSFMVAVVVCAVVVSLAALFPRPVGDPANPAKMPDAIRSTWVVVDVSRAITHYLGVWGFAGFSLLALGLAFVPLFDRRPERSLRRRPVVATIGVVFFLGLLVAWIAGRNLRSAPPSALGRQAVEQSPLVPAAPQPATAGDTSSERAGPQ
jgi:quinol-cytochrome oxidoreductase complex cytochrome b subunit